MFSRTSSSSSEQLLRKHSSGGSSAASSDKKARTSSNPYETPAFLQTGGEDDEEDDVMMDGDIPAELAAAAASISIPESASRKWCRPAPPATTQQSLIFQQFDIDYYVGECRRDIDPAPDGYVGKLPIVRAFGITDSGNSVLAHIHGYQPYFFIPAPAGFTERDCENFRATLDKAVEGVDRNREKPPRYIRAVELTSKMSLMNYRPEGKIPFLKIITSWPKVVPTAKGVLERGFMIGGKSMQFLTYESNVLFALRFMIDAAVVGANWLEIPEGKYSRRATPTSHCQIEVDFHWKDMISHAPEGEWGKVAPLRILSFDIECAGRKGQFPDPTQDPVIQIANILSIQGQKAPLIKNIFTLNTCSAIVGAEVHQFEVEKKMLKQWRDFIIATDPDVVIGYNIINFDLPYLLNRAKKLEIKEFPFLGRIKDCPSRMKDTVFSSKAYGTRESKEIGIFGRVQFDILQAVQRDYKLHSYSLNSVSAKFLGEQKEDVHHSIISDLQNGDADSRRRLAVYCLKDAYLPQRLMDKLMFLYNYIEMSRVTGVPFTYLLARGQQIKVLSQLLRKASTRGLLMPNLEKAHSDEKYDGATVIEPKRGFYAEPIATLDFASLYPSIMMAHNLCYCTLIPKEDMRTGRHGVDLSLITKTPANEHFVMQQVTKGILPEILEELLGARKRAKLDLAKATDPIQKAVLDGRQLALKISANSVYGFTGATVGKLPCLEISASVTAYGRDMIQLTKNKVEETYTIKNGYEHDAVVIYGDTDSVMIKFGSSDLQKTMELGLEAAQIVTKEFIKPIKLEFEKAYYPYLLINKKRYAGLLWTKTDKYDKMDTKGIETVRRDNCPLVRHVVDTCLHKILIEKSVNDAISFVKETISDLLTNRLDISQLVITKALSRSEEDYAGKQAHVELAKRMQQRNPALAPAIGDRVPYVIIKGTKAAKAFEKAEDPIWVLENNIPIDAQHYLDHQLAQPLLRIFEPIMENPQSLLSGDHTRSISVTTPLSGGLSKFTVKTLTCLGCRSKLSNGESTVCDYCQQKEPELCAFYINRVRMRQIEYNKLWTQCQRCQGSLHQEVLCTSRDCPIFYRRRKAQKDLADAEETLKRFQIEW